MLLAVTNPQGLRHSPDTMAAFNGRRGISHVQHGLNIEGDCHGTEKRILVAALAVAALSLGGTACGEGRNRLSRRDGPASRPPEFAGARLDKLHADLKLQPEQEKAWADWSTPIKARAANMKRPVSKRCRKLPAPERMAQMLARMKAHEQEMEAALAATRSFYDVLTPEQRQVFDAFKPFGERGRRHGKVKLNRERG